MLTHIKHTYTYSRLLNEGKISGFKSFIDSFGFVVLQIVTKAGKQYCKVYNSGSGKMLSQDELIIMAMYGA